MADEPQDREFELRYVGRRFDGARLPLDVLPDLPAFRDLIVAFAKDIWRQENPNRQRLPKGFEASLSFDLKKIGEGSAIPTIAWNRKLAQENLPGFQDYVQSVVDRSFDRSVTLFENATFSEYPAKALSPDVLRAIDKFGSSLREDERLEFHLRTDRRGNVVSLDAERRRRLLRAVKETYEQRLYGFGHLVGTNTEPGAIIIVTADHGAAHIAMDAAEVVATYDGNLDGPIQYDITVQIDRKDQIRSVVSVHDLTLVDAEIDKALTKAATRIREIQQLREGWHHGEGLPVSETATDNVLRIVVRRPSLAERFRIFPTLVGGAQIEFALNGWDFAVECRSEGGVEFYGVEVEGAGEFEPIEFPTVDETFFRVLDGRAGPQYEGAFA